MVIYRASGFSFLMALGLAIQAEIKEAERDDDAARRLAEEGLELARTGGYRREEGRALLTLARLQRHAGALDRAEDLFHEALSVFGRSRFPIEMVMTLEELAAIAAAGESYGEAARLIGAAGAARDAIACPLPPIRLAEHRKLPGHASCGHSARRVSPRSRKKAGRSRSKPPSPTRRGRAVSGNGRRTAGQA